ncbi:hypothetical protein BS17DRAFT_765315 [Gyrodon lividus]|nr:hypothetical protein BS17DRAFT_765315 [Gyrodon lividus]
MTQADSNPTMVMSSHACSEANEPDADAETSLNVLLIIHLDTYTASSVSNGTTTSKSKTKETKSTKAKEITLMLSASNYLDFLTMMLAKDGKDKYKVTEKKTYSFKYLLPPVKVFVFMLQFVKQAAAGWDSSVWTENG